MSISLKTQNLSSKSVQFFHDSPPINEDWARRVFTFCVLFIVCVSIYDTYLVSAYRNGIMVAERNPICRYLIGQDLSQLSWFIGGKLLGNLIVTGTLLGLYFSGFRHALTVAKGVALFQLSLLVYLHGSDPRSGLLHFDDIGSNVPWKFYAAVRSLLIHIAVMLVFVVGVLCAKRKWKHMRSALMR